MQQSDQMGPRIDLLSFHRRESYYTLDDETMGCRVERSKVASGRIPPVERYVIVTIVYEGCSQVLIEPGFDHMCCYCRLPALVS